MSKTKVLIADDEENFARMMKINLEGTGNYEVECQSSSLQVVPTAKAFRPDIVLLDIVMPGMDGGDVKRQFEADPELKSIPIVFVTALVSKADTTDGAIVESGGQVMLAKPVELDQLITCIETQLAGEN